MTDTENVYKDFIRKLQSKTQLGKYRLGQDDINTEPGVGDSTTAQVESQRWAPMFHHCLHQWCRDFLKN
jgi:hypothetical protein